MVASPAALGAEMSGPLAAEPAEADVAESAMAGSSTASWQLADIRAPESFADAECCTAEALLHTSSSSSPRPNVAEEATLKLQGVAIMLLPSAEPPTLPEAAEQLGESVPPSTLPKPSGAPAVRETPPPRAELKSMALLREAARAAAAAAAFSAFVIASAALRRRVCHTGTAR